MQLLVAPDGRIRCIYAEAIDVAMLGEFTIQRASHVEPDRDGKWRADLSPVQGPILGPFKLRSDAFEAEISWLERHWLTGRSDQPQE